ncbi:hypothetical protein ACFYM2_21050 [Streptomyces sp. NPDC006711]|uniref:hypothetical protein n=1 Tax=Streptomyces sp. NPDC006711 TaxID=3364762 RepID=UPI003685D9B2
MPDRPPRQLPPPPDTGAAGAGTLVDIGVLDPQSEPPPPEYQGLFLEPAIEDDEVPEIA